jgi:hypothetical protein
LGKLKKIKARTGKKIERPHHNQELDMVVCAVSSKLRGKLRWRITVPGPVSTEKAGCSGVYLSSQLLHEAQMGASQSNQPRNEFKPQCCPPPPQKRKKEKNMVKTAGHSEGRSPKIPSLRPTRAIQ